MISSKITIKVIFLILFSWSCLVGAEKPTALVTIGPYQFFVEKIAGDTLKVLTLVPPAASSHTFEPTPQQTLAASRTTIWFTMGEPFETRALRAFQGHNPSLIVVDLRQGVDLITSTHTCNHGGSCSHAANSADLHLWLSPRVAQIQAKTIADHLIKTFPEHAEQYSLALQSFLKELKQLDQEITATLKPLENRTLMVSHPAYAYLSRDQDLTQLSIEFEGRDPTPRQLTDLLQEARQKGVSTIFVQSQYSSKGARLIASHLNAKIVELDPYSEDYFNSLRQIARHFAEK